MGLKEDVIEIQKEVKEVKEQSIAWEILKDSKKANKKICFAFTLIIITISTFWFLTGIYLVEVLNDLGATTSTSETKEQTISNVDTMNNNQIINGDYNEDSK